MNIADDLTELDEINILRPLMPVDQGEKFIQALKTAGAYFKQSVVEYIINRPRQTSIHAQNQQLPKNQPSDQTHN